MSDLTPSQQAYFDTLETLSPSPQLRAAVEAAKDDLRRAALEAAEELTQAGTPAGRA